MDVVVDLLLFFLLLSPPVSVLVMRSMSDASFLGAWPGASFKSMVVRGVISSAAAEEGVVVFS